MVDPAGDDGLVGVAFQEIDDDLLAYAGDEHGPPSGTRPELADANPAGAFFVPFSLAIPMELDLDSAVLVRVDLLSGRSHDDGGLHAVHDRAGGGPFGAEVHFGRDAEKLVVVFQAGRTREPFLDHLGLRAELEGFHHEVVPVETVQVVLFERKPETGRQPWAGAFARGRVAEDRRLLEPHLCQGLAPFDLFVGSGIVVDLGFPFALGLVVAGQIEGGALEIVIPQGGRAGAHPPGQHESGHELLIDRQAVGGIEYQAGISPESGRS